MEKLLSIFEQANLIKSESNFVISKLYPHKIDDEDIQLMASVLHEMIADPIERAEIEKEAEALRILDDVFLKTNREQAKVIVEQAKALEEQAKALEKKDEVIEEKDKALEEQAKQIEELKRLLGKQ